MSNPAVVLPTDAQQQQEQQGQERDCADGKRPDEHNCIGVTRSGESEEKFYVRFVNTTQRTATLIWLDYEGREVRQKSLSPQTAYSVFTYSKHPWIVRDTDTGERLAVQKAHGAKSRRFEADNFLACLARSPEYTQREMTLLSEGKRLICVFITHPVDDLRHLALRTARGHLGRKEDCFCLDVPQAIQFQLAQLF
jgi:hypothetical protein